MAGMMATPALGKWPREYTWQPEPPAKRGSGFSPSPHDLYAYDMAQYHNATKRHAVAPAVLAYTADPYGKPYGKPYGEPYAELYGGGVPVPTPPPSISVAHTTPSRSRRASAELDTPIRTKSGFGPRASHFCGAVTFLWFSMWPTAKTYLCTRRRSQGIYEESRARPEFMQYARSLIEKAELSEQILTLSLLFLYRFRETRAKRAARAPFDRHPTSEARVLVVALMTANKLLDDISYTTATWSKMSGIDLQELKRMETEFLLGLDFNLHVPAKQWTAWEQLVTTTLYPAVESLGRA